MITQVSKWGQKEALGKGVEVVVATPGRLIDLMQEGIISLAQVKLPKANAKKTPPNSPRADAASASTAK